MHITAGVFGPRSMGHLIKISDRMFAWYILVKQPLAFMKMPLLSVPSGGQGHTSRSNECIFEKKIRKCSSASIFRKPGEIIIYKYIVHYIWPKIELIELLCFLFLLRVCFSAYAFCICMFYQCVGE